MGEILVGAAIGFVGSTVGAMIIERLNLRRRLRLALYEDHLRALHDRLRNEEDLSDVMDEIRRASQLLGAGDKKQYEGLRVCYSRRHNYQKDYGVPQEDSEQRKYWETLTSEVAERIQLFEEYLADKLLTGGFRAVLTRLRRPLDRRRERRQLRDFNRIRGVSK
ncbi:MAG: hypothetical protein ACRDJV_09175 [Actinomycetota bacterium]